MLAAVTTEQNHPVLSCVETGLQTNRVIVMGRPAAPPDEITLVYRPVGPSHVFTATGPSMSGFHISSPDLKVAFDLAGVALGKHVALIYGVHAHL